jgi:hypothetical protein
MTVSTSGSNFGRYVFGAAVVASGLVMLVWRDYHLTQVGYLLNATDGPAFVYAAAAAQVFGGIAILFRRAARIGAVVPGAVYLVFALVCVPRIIAAPQIYDRWGNFFEPFSLATGAAIVYARFSSNWAPEAVRRIGRILFGVCTASFTLEQAFYLRATAELVPTWLPLGQMFWAIATTVAFGLAAVALLTNCKALLATRLLTLMVVLLALLVWIPLVVSDPHSHVNWSELAESVAIAGAAWILADVLGEHRLNDRRSTMT